MRSISETPFGSWFPCIMGSTRNLRNRGDLNFGNSLNLLSITDTSLIEKSERTMLALYISASHSLLDDDAVTALKAARSCEAVIEYTGRTASHFTKHWRSMPVMLD